MNALTLDMIRALDDKLAEWAADTSIRAVMIHGAGDKAFCAGGDIRALYDAKQERQRARCCRSSSGTSIGSITGSRPIPSS